MKKILLILISLFLISAIPVTVFAHSGRTDANGGHYDYEENEYHYHHGYPAHQHPNGVCPYSEKNVEKQEEKELGFFGTFFKALQCLFVGALGAMMVIVCISYVVILILAFTGIYDKIGSDKIFDVGLKIIFILWILLSLFFAWRIFF